MHIITIEDASNKGMTRYFTGKPCKYDHIVERMVSNGSCVLCAKYNKRKYIQNKKMKEHLNAAETR